MNYQKIKKNNKKKSMEELLRNFEEYNPLVEYLNQGHLKINS